jgi:hypothetical protein
VAALCGPGCGYCGRCTAAWERDDEDDDRTDVSSVRVETQRDGYRGETFIRCTADSFDRGILTITAIDTEREVRIFTESEWLDAVAYDASGNVLFDIINPLQSPAA